MRQATPLAIPYEQPRVEYSMGASPPLTYAIPWIFWTLDQDLQAVIVDATGEHPLVYGTDYTVAGTPSSDPTSSYYVNGTITLLSSGWSNCTLTLWRLPLLRRLFDISETGPLDVHTLNAQLDQIVTTLQDLMLRINAQYGRDYTELGNSFPAFTLPTPQDGYLLGWLGQNLINQAPNAVAYGPAGPTGPTGPSGNPGIIGPTGPGSTASGPTGPIGPAGPQGFDGAIGATGAAGVIGPTGPGNPYIVVTNLVTNPPDVNNPPLAPPTGLLVADTSVADFVGYPTGPTGPMGPTGPAGSSVAGPVGPGVPVGGAIGQALIKNTAANFDTSWGGPMLPLAGGTLTGNLTISSPAGVGFGDGHSFRLIWDASLPALDLYVDGVGQGDLIRSLGVAGNYISVYQMMVNTLGNALYVWWPTSGVAYATLAAPSDRKLKRNISDATIDALALINGLKVYECDMQLPWGPAQHWDCSLMADEIATAIPPAYVQGTAESYDSIVELPVVATLVRAVQQLTARVKALEEKLP